MFRESPREPTRTGVIRAAEKIAAILPPTPLLPLEIDGVRLWAKCENLQPIGAFKIRGAANAVAQLSADEMRDGVWTVSAGNAAQGLAFAARQAGVRCSVLVMDTAPAAKLDAIRRLGAEIVQAPYAECWDTVESHANPRMRGHFVHPFDDDAFISGNGTAGLEIVEQMPDVDAVVASIGGGGLLSGVGCAVKSLKPDVIVYGAEPETAAPFDASVRANAPVTFDRWETSFVDGAGGRSVLPSMWPLMRRYIDTPVVVALADARAAMKLVAERCHVIAEGAGATAIAAARSARVREAGHRKIAVVVSGGNIDLARFTELIHSS